MNDIRLYSNLLHPAINSVISSTTNAAWNLSSTTVSGIAVPIELYQTETIDFVEIYLGATGASTGFRCRIVNHDTKGLPDTTSLVHANATASITATTSAWNKHNFTDFSLAAGKYWIVWDVTQITTALTPHYNLDYRSGGTLPSRGVNDRPVSFDGTDWDTSITGNVSALRARIKASSGYLSQSTLAPCVGYTGIDALVMDTSENPNCRGMRWVADFTGDLAGWDLSISGFSGSTSYELVMASEGCATELARVEVWEMACYQVNGIHRVRFDSPVAVVAGTSYDVYVTPGSDSGSTTGVAISAIDVSEDSATMCECYGVPVGDLLGMYVHQPVTEGGAGTPTTSADYIFPWIPVYSTITTSSGGGLMVHPGMNGGMNG